MSDESVLDLFAVTAPGLEPLCAAELRGLDIGGAVVDGGVAWRGGRRSLYRANLELRTASRVLARLGEYRARTFAELERHAAKLPWRRYIASGAGVSLRVTSRKSKLYHSDAVAERIGRVVLAAAGAVIGTAGRGDEDDDAAGAQLIVVRLLRDVCTISVDSSGPLLHQRGYRQALAKAPLRETLAAALLQLSDWTGDRALADPLCGSGTIPIEAALLARRIAPGLASAGHSARSYAFEAWPEHDRTLWCDVVAASRARIRAHPGVPIIGSDRNAGALAASLANAARAGVAGDIEWSTRPLARLALPAGPGAVVTNPPYGVRIGERAAVGPLYRELGRVLRERAAGWTLTLLSADPRLDAAVGVALHEQVRTRNGGIAVRVMSGTVPASGGPAGGAGVSWP